MEAKMKIDRDASIALRGVHKKLAPVSMSPLSQPTP
jgi:hypothetical protein